ncbi:MAG: diaminobutyrate--2-oxoglutarate transaminase family protein [Desulfobacterales bacterium]|nr:diaminobutyrate--2-oxoglutarate transaminase family protein [Desulfobacterales bacterium]
MNDDVFLEFESRVRLYCRTFPAVFDRAKDAILYDEDNKEYIDFFAGAGSLNYGHNNTGINREMIEYIRSDRILQGLDFHTAAKRRFIRALTEKILLPRDLRYKVQFCGPGGANAVEAALKLARKIKNRSNIFAFMGAYHGLSLGSLAATGNKKFRHPAFGAAANVTFMPYPFGFMNSFDVIDYMDAVLQDPGSGVDKPAAVIMETVQAEGGVIVAPAEFLSRLEALCARHDILLICDDIQVGCGRTGPFFSFERANIVPDMVVVSKSISGAGLPLSLLLLKPDLDAWEHGEHTGTFRGNQLGFVGGAAALDYWVENNIMEEVKRKEGFVSDYLNERVLALDDRIEIRGLGLIWGVDLSGLHEEGLTDRVVKRCFERGLVIESAGRNGEVLKLMPPLNIEMELLEKGCAIMERALSECMEGG